MFNFVNDRTLKKNIISNLIHTIYLVNSVRKLQLTKGATSLFNNDALVHIGAVLEALLVYFLREKQVIKYSVKWKYFDERPYHQINNDIEIVIAKRKSDEIKVGSNTSLQNLIKGTYKEGIIDEEIKTVCENIRNLRNLVHFSGLGREQRKLTTKDVEKASADLTTISKFIRARLDLRPNFTHSSPF